MKADVIQNFYVVVIGEGYVFKCHFSLYGRKNGYIVFVPDGGRGVQDFENPLGAGNVCNNLVIKIT